MHISRKQVGCALLCAIAVPGCWLAIRLPDTYLPEPALAVASLDREVSATVATVQHAAGDMQLLEEGVRSTAQEVLPTVVAVKTVGKDEYASGVIVTADGIVLSQWHVSHWPPSSDGIIRSDSSPSLSAGDRATVILHDGRECPAELLGANRTHDISLLRLLAPGPYPHAPIRPGTAVKVGDWVLKIGHALGFREGRSAPVRLGRVIAGNDLIFSTDCMSCGGDSGGPYFNLDGQLMGVTKKGSNPALTFGTHEEMIFSRRVNALNLMSVSGIRLIDSLFDSMLHGQVSLRDMEEDAKIDRELATSERLGPADWSQGSATLNLYRQVVASARSSVVVIQNAGVAVSLGTIVGSDGWILTKASAIPNQPTCLLPDGSVVSAEIVGADPAFDLALLKLPATDLQPVKWADNFDPPVGEFLAAVGRQQRPLAVGVASVPRRNLPTPMRPMDTLPLRIVAGRPQIYGDPRPRGGYSLRAALGSRRPNVYLVSDVFSLAWSAGVRPSDLLHSINGRRIVSDEDLVKAVANRLTGDVVPVRLKRAGRMIDLKLPLEPKTRYTEHNYRADDFPTVIECAVPFFSYECGGPVVDLSGRAIGISIARVATHGGMLIPGDCIQELLPHLQTGALAGSWPKDGSSGK